MTVILVTHETELPAVDGMIAGMIAAERGAALATLVTGGAGLGRYDCQLHVYADGGLGANGVFWAEWASGRLAEMPMQAAAVARHPAAAVVVAINPAIQAHVKSAERIAHAAKLVGRGIERLDVTDEDGTFMVRDSREARIVSRWRRDRYGRPFDAGKTAPATTVSKRAGLLIVGDENLLCDTYPAVLAGLGDAADRLGLELDISFWDPRDSDLASIGSVLAGIDGIVLPGGSDMEQVSGQIDVAQFAIRHDVPTVGLCLGMQTMATAVAREIGGFNDANMEEADPGAQVKTFIRLRDEQDRPQFRVGLLRPRVQAGTVLSRIFGGAERIDVHCNHRYVLDPRLHIQLERAGLAISGRQDGRDLADAIELPSLRFFVGMQGHPELMARRDRPHPLLLAFLGSLAGG